MCRRKTDTTPINVLISLGFTLITELAERSPIIKQNTSNPSSQKNLDVWPHDCTTIQGATFNMPGQLYRRHANAMAFFSSPVVSALGSKSDYPGSSPSQGKVLCPWDVQEKKKVQVPLLGLAKSILSRITNCMAIKMWKCMAISYTSSFFFRIYKGIWGLVLLCWWIFL